LGPGCRTDPEAFTFRPDIAALAKRAATPLVVWGFLLDAGAAFFSELEWASTGLSAEMGRTSVWFDEHGRGWSDGH